MKKKIRVGILFGGRSAEHDISLISASNVVAALDPKKYEPVLIGIDKEGRWHSVDTLVLPASRAVDKASGDVRPKLPAEGEARQGQQRPEPGGQTRGRLKTNTERAVSGEEILQSTAVFARQKALNIVFPVLHGPFGEDGTIQGLLKLAGIPFVGASVLGSAVGMDKDVMKRLLREAGIPTAKCLVFREYEKDIINFRKARQILGLPIFIKPANLGSSVGVSRVANEKEFTQAVREAFRYDRKILIEEAIVGREIECAVLGNESPQASGCGEIIPQDKHRFYSYAAKYLDENGAVLKIPADISRLLTKKIQTLAVEAFQTLECEGMARVDFFLRNDGAVFINEINTIPGFTQISMYPKLWVKAGLSYRQLIDRLIQLALARHAKEMKLKTDHR